MNPVILFWAIPILAIAACLLTFYANQLYIKIYERYVSFEPASIFRIPFSNLAGTFFILMIAFSLSPAFLLAQGYGYSSQFIFLCGFAIAYFATFISRSLSSMGVYYIVHKHSHLISGQIVIKGLLYSTIAASVTLQLLTFAAMLAFFMPYSPFLLGAITALVFATAINYLSKYSKQITC